MSIPGSGPGSAALISESTTLVLWPLRSRPDGADAVAVGRPETGTFITVPPVALVIIELLGQGLSVADTTSRISARGGPNVDIAEFARDLIALGFVAEIDGRPVEQPTAEPASLAWIGQRHTQWLLHPAVAVAVGVLVALGAAVILARPQVLPTYRDLVWSDYGGLVLAGNVALTWLIIFVHELAHLLTARAAGASGRITLGTRLQFLAAQTDVSGVWAEPRRIRLTVYLAGIAVNLVLAAVGLLVRASTPKGGGAYQLAGLMALIAVLLLVPQVGVFMRTDLYFVLADLTRCPNLYAEGAAYLAHWFRRLFRRAPATGDPTAQLSAREARVVRGYSVLLLVGTACCLLAALTITYPAAVLLVAQALRTLAEGGVEPLAVLDAVGTLVLVVALQLTWGVAWWRRHRRHLVGLRSALRGKGGEA